MRRLGMLMLSAALVGLASYWLITMPHGSSGEDLAGLSGDPVAGKTVFVAAGCASCHTAPGAGPADPPLLAGGQSFPSAFGTFLAPNISSDPDAGIGKWSLRDLANAVQHGISPKGAHYFPVLPYWSYQRMTPQDMADLYAYVMTLPADATPSQPHQVAFPFNIRRNLGVWKFLNMRPDFVVTDVATEAEIRGRYIAEALAHCGECHTPRDALGGLDVTRWLAGAPNPSGPGSVPNITPAKLTWSEDEIVEYLTSGFTPEYDSVGGHMAHVVENMSRRPEEDRRAIAAYLKKVPPVQ